MNRLVLIDGNAILHRAYHALPPLTDPEGIVVNAVYGFTSMLIKLFGDLKPTHLAVAFDRPKPTFRKKLYKEYQATRPKMDDELVPQIPRVHDVVSAMGIPIFEMDGYEADDVIGTLCQKILNPKSEILNKSKTKNSKDLQIDQIIIVTGDRDILQLVEDEKVLLYMPTKGLSEARLYGEKETAERMGVTPEQIPDFKALAGDSSDHYPGVAGIGPKTAIDLLTKYGSVEKLYKALEAGKIHDVSSTVCAKLTADKGNALMSHQLATIVRDVPIDYAIHPLTSLDTKEAQEVLGTLGFKSLIKRLHGTNADVEEKLTKDDTKDNGEQLSLV